jgi:hypothetical protein
VLEELDCQTAPHPGDLIAVICADQAAHQLTGTEITDRARVVPVSEAPPVTPRRSSLPAPAATETSTSP